MEVIVAKKVEMGKEYVTGLHGWPVEILKVGINTGRFDSVVAIVKRPDGTEDPILMNEYGYKYNRSDPYIREVGSFDHINIGYKYRGHFAGVTKDGAPKIWVDGKSEWSSHGLSQSFKFCEKVIEDEQSE